MNLLRNLYYKEDKRIIIILERKEKNGLFDTDCVEKK